MVKLFLKIFDVLSRHRPLTAVLTCIFLLLCGLSALRMDYDEDISAFMPLDGQTAKYSEVFGNLGGQDRIAVIFAPLPGGDGDPAVVGGAMEAFGRAAARRDSARMMKNLRISVDETAMADVLRAVWKTYPALLSDVDYRDIDSLLYADGRLAERMEQNKRMLMLPVGGFLSQGMPYDPLHLSTGVTGRLRGLNIGDGYKTVDGYLFKDSAGIVLLESPFGISESRNNGNLQRLLDSCMADVRAEYPSLSVSAVGAPLIAATNAGRIKSDSLLAVGLSVVLILSVLMYSFRRAGDLAWIGVSVFAGWLFALGAIALIRDSISLIVIGIGSVIIGIAVNYPLHFIDHLKHETDMREVLREMVPPLLVGNITTVSAFLCLVLLDARAMQDLGLFGSLVLVGTILFVLVCLPVFLKLRGRESRGGEFPPFRFAFCGGGRVKRAMPWVVAVLTAVFACFSSGTSFDSDMQNINYMLPKQREDLKFLSSGIQAGGDSTLVLYVVAEGETADDALRNGEKALARMSGIEGIRNVASIAGLVPSDSLYARRIAKWDEFWACRPDAGRRFMEAAQEAGFAPGAFRPFMDMIRSPYPARDSLPLGQDPVYSLIGRNFIMQSDGGCKAVSFVQADKRCGGEVKSRIASALPEGCYVFSQADVSNHLAEVLSESFNYIGFVCGFVVFAFLWLSFGSIELSLMSFLPLAVSWIWILGIMQLSGMQFNIVNIILATFIFGQGDDYTIFITEGLMYEYTTGKRRLERYKGSVALSAAIMFIGIGTLIFSKHPAMRSLAEVAVIGMVTVVVMAYYLPPLLFRWLTEKDGKRREYPVTLSRLAYSFFSFAFFFCGMFILLVPYTCLVHRPLRRVWNGERFYHRLLQGISAFVIRHVPGVKFREVNTTGEAFDKPAVIVCNHQSHLDLMCIMQLSPKIIVLTNDWAWNNPLYRLVIHTAEFYPISNGYDRNFPQLRDLVRRGYSVLVFPEGTRTPDGRIGRFHKGAFTLARALGVDILPLCIHGLYDVLPKHDFMLRRGSVTLEVCGRIPAGTVGAGTERDIMHAVHRWYVDKYAAMRERLETPAYLAPYVAYRNKYKIKA